MPSSRETPCIHVIFYLWFYRPTDYVLSLILYFLLAELSSLVLVSILTVLWIYEFLPLYYTMPPVQGLMSVYSILFIVCLKSCWWLCCVWIIYPFLCFFWCQKIGTSSIIWALLNRLLSKDADKITVSETRFLNKNMTMNIVQKVNNYVQPIA
jgi:hypothetical protein